MEYFAASLYEINTNPIVKAKTFFYSAFLYISFEKDSIGILTT